MVEALGKARIVIRDGKVVEIGEPQIKYCPLFHKYRGMEKIDLQTIEENIKFRIEDFGMCTPQRQLKMKDFLSFGISETLGTLLEENLIECAVIVCEGCGTVIIEDPQLIQGIGGRISGIVSTTPIEEIIYAVDADQVLDIKTAEINQVKGVLKAINKGYQKIAVTVADAADARDLREVEIRHLGVEIYIFAVHTTGISLDDAEELFKYADVITSCASKHLRSLAEHYRVFSVGASIPIYAASSNGENFLKMRIEKIGGLKEKKKAKIPDPLI